jgi:heme-degrading monooxygenase HmoA
MSEQIMSIAIMEPYPGKEEELESLLREFYLMLKAKGYCRNKLVRNTGHAQYVNIRYWKSEEDRRLAQEDPDVHRYWAKLPAICEMRAVYETLMPVENMAEE